MRLWKTTAVSPKRQKEMSWIKRPVTAIHFPIVPKKGCWKARTVIRGATLYQE